MARQSNARLTVGQKKTVDAKGNFQMKRIAVLTLLVLFSVGYSIPTKAQDSNSKTQRQADKLAQKKATQLYKYQQKQEKAQEKAQRKADKQQQKEARKYEKQQRKLLKSQKLPPNHTS